MGFNEAALFRYINDFPVNRRGSYIRLTYRPCYANDIATRVPRWLCGARPGKAGAALARLDRPMPVNYPG
jgi:hypothetical protein